MKDIPQVVYSNNVCKENNNRTRSLTFQRPLNLYISTWFFIINSKKEPFCAFVAFLGDLD